MVFGVSLDHFFAADNDEPLVAVVREEQRLKLPFPPGDEQPAYLFESLDYPASNRRMDAFYAEFPPNSRSSEPHRHGSAEFVYLLSGRLSVDVDGKETTLGAGDAIYFDSSVPHSYRREGKGACTAVVVTAS